MKKQILIIFLKVVIYAATLLLAFLGVSAVVSCSVQHSVDAVGSAKIITTDTTVINHNGVISFPKR